MTLLRIWLTATAMALAVMAIWAFAPVLVFVAVLTAALGLLAFAMIAFARWLQAWRERR